MARFISQIFMVGCALLIVGTPMLEAGAAYDVRLIDPVAWADSGRVSSTVYSPRQMNATVGIWVDPASTPSHSEGGFDFQIVYDGQFSVFNGISRGPDLHPDWEYFTYRTGSDTVGSTIRSLVRIIGIADLIGDVTPPDSTFELAGHIANVVFYVENFGSPSDTCVPLTFYSRACTDNTISNRTGDSLFIPGSGHETSPAWDSASCVGSLPGTIHPEIAFTAGTICIMSMPTRRGDINLNGIANEIADAVLFSRFLTYGFNVFTSPFPLVQYQATDIYCDGVPGTPLDMMYLIAIIAGQAQPCDSSTQLPPGGTVPSVDDTLRIPDITVGPGDVFDVDILMTNVDFVGTFTCRLEFDSSFMWPMGTYVDSVLNVNSELLRDTTANTWAVSAAMVEPGIVTMSVVSFAPDVSAITPGSGPTVRLQFYVPHASAGQSGLLQFVTDPIYPDIHNALADAEATICKRPQLVSGTVTVTSGICDCPFQGDLDGDGTIGNVDLNMLISVLFFSATDVLDPDCTCTRADVNADGVSDSVDLNMLIQHIFYNSAAPTDPCAQPNAIDN